MNTEKPGQQSDPQDPTQRDKDQQQKGGQQNREGYGQHNPQQDRKPGQGQQGDMPDKDRKSA
ncbi:MAG: hypothetical protein WA628_05095 [Terriglobales bacterium]